MIGKQHGINDYSSTSPQIFEYISGCPYFLHFSGKPVRAPSRPGFSRRAPQNLKTRLRMKSRGRAFRLDKIYVSSSTASFRGMKTVFFAVF